MQLVFNPLDGKIYRRYTHTVGVDISIEDGRIYKNPADKSPASFSFLKFPDNLPDDCSLDTTFSSPYQLQSRLGRSIRDKNSKRLFYLPRHVEGQTSDSDNDLQEDVENSV